MAIYSWPLLHASHSNYRAVEPTYLYIHTYKHFFSQVICSNSENKNHTKSLVYMYICMYVGVNAYIFCTTCNNRKNLHARMPTYGYVTCIYIHIYTYIHLLSAYLHVFAFNISHYFLSFHFLHCFMHIWTYTCMYVCTYMNVSTFLVCVYLTCLKTYIIHPHGGLELINRLQSPYRTVISQHNRNNNKDYFTEDVMQAYRT